MVPVTALERIGRTPTLDDVACAPATAAVVAVKTLRSPRTNTRARKSRYRGSRSFMTASNGLAMKIDEYAPLIRPTKRAKP